MMSGTDDQNGDALAGRRVAFLGKLGGVTRREIQAIVRERGGLPVRADDQDADLIVIGAEELPLGETLRTLEASIKHRAAAGDLEIVSETQFWQMLGLVESEQLVRRLYTPAMLAELLNVSVSTIRGWHRRGLIVPAREVHRLPYFDFQEISTARCLAQLLAAGASPKAIERQLADLSRYLPDVERPLAQLSVIVEGKTLLMRQGAGLIEPGGQLRLDFDAHPGEAPAEEMFTASMRRREGDSLVDTIPQATPEQLWEAAVELEEAGRLEEAIQLHRAALAAGGPRAENCFQLAELLYRTGDVTAARERYYMAIELDEDYVEARSNLGCVLVETGQEELAVAAFHGALRVHDDYPDAHFHLARLLDDLGRPEEAKQHWQAFLRLAADSPWAEMARIRLQDEA